MLDADDRVCQFDEKAYKEKQPITSRSYKIKAAVIIVLLLVAFVVKDFIIFKRVFSFNAEATGLAQFLPWWIRDQWQMLVIGMGFILIPWELMYKFYLYILHIHLCLNCNMPLLLFLNI